MIENAMPRIIYSLHLDCERVPGEPITAFVVPLDRRGQAPPFAWWTTLAY